MVGAAVGGSTGLGVGTGGKVNVNGAGVSGVETVGAAVATIGAGVGVMGAGVRLTGAGVGATGLFVGDSDSILLPTSSRSLSQKKPSSSLIAFL